MFNPALTLVIVTLVTGPSLVQASPVIESTRVQLLVKDGDNVTLPCVITDLGHHKVVWRRGNEIISVMKKNALKKITDDPRLSPTVSSLALHRVVAPDSGVYSCEVFETPASPVLAQLSHNLTVQSSTKYEAPRIGNTPAHITPYEGSSVTLSCGVSGHPPPTVQWIREVSTTSPQKNCGCSDASLPTSTTRTSLGVSENITFSRIQRSDSGVYNCTASNGVGEVVTFSIELQVMFAPSVSVPMEKVHSGRDVHTVFCCDIDGYPQPSIRWLKFEKPSNPYRNLNTRNSVFRASDGFTGNRGSSDQQHVWGFHENEDDRNWVPVSPTRLKKRTCSNRATDMVRKTLNIERFLKRDFGLYRCVASNPLGDSSGSVVVTGEPWALNVVSETDSMHSNSYMLAWQVNSYSDILHYELSISRTSDKVEPTINYTVPSIKKQVPTYHSQVKNLTNLTPGGTYEVHIRAKNDYGYADLELPFFFNTINEDGSFTTDYASTPGLINSYDYPTDYADMDAYQQPLQTEVKATNVLSQDFPASNEMPRSDTLHGNVSLSGTPSPAPPSASPPHSAPPALGALLTAVALSVFFSLSASRWCAG